MTSLLKSWLRSAEAEVAGVRCSWIVVFNVSNSGGEICCSDGDLSSAESLQTEACTCFYPGF